MSRQRKWRYVATVTGGDVLPGESVTFTFDTQREAVNFCLEQNKFDGVRCSYTGERIADIEHLKPTHYGAPLGMAPAQVPLPEVE